MFRDRKNRREMEVRFIGFGWKRIKKGLRGYGVKVWLKSGSEPDTCSNAHNEAYDINTDLVDRGDNEGADAHGEIRD
jgi:hypothetical protein